jgi:bacteriorhodopsin
MVLDVAKHGHIFPPHGKHIVEHITSKGVSWLQFVTIVMTVAFFVFVGAAVSRTGKNRANALCSYTIAGIAALSYLAMATQTGSVVINVGGADRQIFYARYIDWLFTTPLLLLDVLLLSGIAIGDLIWIVVADILMILTGLISALVTEGQWVWFTIGCVAMLAVFYGLLGPGRQMAYGRSDTVGRSYTGLVVYLLVLWTLYPIVFALAEGTGKITPDKEVVLYGILDILAKVVFGAIVVSVAPHQESTGESFLEKNIAAPLLGRSDDNIDDTL